MSFIFKHQKIAFKALVISLLCMGTTHVKADRNVLWNIVDQECGSAQDDHSKCLVTDKKQGFVILKDLHGPVHTLTIPTKKVAGVEEPLLLKSSTRNYFYDAWKYRGLLNDFNEKRISERYLTFSVNSKYTRTQDQLHIHASCLRTDVYDVLKRNRSKIGHQWKPLNEKITGYTFLAKKVKVDQIRKNSPFIALNEYVRKKTKDGLDQYGVAMVSPQNNEIIYLGLRTEKSGAQAVMEGIQDPSCAITRRYQH